MSQAREFHAIIHRRRPALAVALESIKDDLTRGMKKITLTREQAEMIVSTFPLFRKD